VTLTPSGENLAKEWQYVEQTEYKDIVRAAYTGYLEPSQDDGSDVISGKWVVPIAERELVAISIPAYSFASDEFAVEFSRRWKVRPYVQGIECDKPDMDSHYADASTIIHTHKTYSGSAQIVRTNGKRETATVSFKED